jgi:hypothetical protein
MISIVNSYMRRGYRMTARQLYYQLVSANAVTNTDKSYKRVTSILSRARYAGLISWDAIEDRGRVPQIPAEWENAAQRGLSANRTFRLDRWAGQPTYVELWVEKQALAAILWNSAARHHIPLMVNKGYSSSSSMKESADRFIKRTWLDADDDYLLNDILPQMRNEVGSSSGELVFLSKQFDERFADSEIRPSILLYLGDLDPSGEDMVRDIEARLREFGVFKLEVQKVAITPELVEIHNPPPNPAKMTDPRSDAYRAKFGNNSWELDCLGPDVLTELIDDAIKPLIDQDVLDKVLAYETVQREWMEKQLKRIEKKVPENENDEE